MRESNQKLSAENQSKVAFGNQSSRVNDQKVIPERPASRPFQRPAQQLKPQPASTTPAPQILIPKPLAVSKPEAPLAPETYNVRLTLRDWKIIEFILDMKFASKEEIWRRFFSKLRSNENSTSLRWAEQRLLQLERAGYLKAVQSFSEKTKYFLTTEKGYVGLTQNQEMNKLPKHVRAIDQRCFIHDKLVLHSRIEFEKAYPTGKWISDRKLHAGMASMFGLPSAMIPDAIYELPTGERVAFELENAYKGPKAYGEKITFFVRLMRMKKGDPNIFEKVRFRCVKPEVEKKLKEMTAMYSDIFQVELWAPTFELPAKATSEDVHV